LLITGNELLPSGTAPYGARIADANGPMLEALVRRDGGSVPCAALVSDEPGAILEALRAPADVVIVSGGSSVGIEDYAPSLVAAHGELAIHGIAMRPSSPTGMGRLDDRLVFLLPGNPVSSLCAYDFFAGRAIRALGGRDRTWPYRDIRGTLTRKISSPIGRLDYARVVVVSGVPGLSAAEGSRTDSGLATIEPLAIAGASILSSTTRADGFVVVPDDSEGFASGAEVTVWLYA
jgi:molybdopterin molybdotransferase